jgi:hypothetical protein
MSIDERGNNLVPEQREMLDFAEGEDIGRIGEIVLVVSLLDKPRVNMCWQVDLPTFCRSNARQCLTLRACQQGILTVSPQKTGRTVFSYDGAECAPKLRF